MSGQGAPPALWINLIRLTTMLRLMETPERFEHAIIEASGVSEPDRIMDFARLDPMLRPDAIIVLADAETVEARLADGYVGEVVAKQIACADILLLNKADLADGQTLAGAGRAIRALNQDAPLLQCHEAALPLDVLLGSGLGKDGVEAMHHHGARQVFHTAAFRAAKPIDRAAFEEFANSLPADILRGKGVLVFRDAPRIAHDWQRVGGRMTLQRLARPVAGGCELVLIGAKSLEGVVANGIFTRS